MNHVGTQPIQTRRLRLRRHTMADAAPMFMGWASDPSVTRYLFWETHPDPDVTRAVLEMWTGQYEEPGFYNWAIDLEGKLIGNIAAFNCDDASEMAEVGYSLARPYWGQGIMPEAVRGVLGFLFERVGLHRVYMRHDVENAASGRVMEKAGLTYEGALRQHVRRKDGAWADVKYWGILREEWLENKEET